VAGAPGRLPYAGGVPVLVVAAVVLAIWYLSRRWQASGGPAAAQRLAGVLRWIWRGFLALLAVAALAAMAQGCDGEGDAQPEAPACAAYDPADCTTGGIQSTTTTSAGLNLGEEPRYAPCPAFHEEDCPPAPAGP
jgi:hypothetical protein